MPHLDKDNKPNLNIFLLNPIAKKEEDDEEKELEREEERQNKLLLFQILNRISKKMDDLPHTEHTGGSF